MLPLSLRRKFSLLQVNRITADHGGTYNVGDQVNESLTYLAGSSLTVDGGSLNVAGRIYAFDASAYN